jgi:hypothetical protein
MDKNELAEQLKYSSSDCLLIVTWKNLLKQMFCPFRVLVMTDIGPLKKGQIVWVQQVKVTMELKTVFVIDGGAYFFSYFDILID